MGTPVNQVTANEMDSAANSADSSITPNAPIKRKKLPLKMIASVIFLVMLVVGGGAGYYLTQVNQDVRQQAAGGTYGTGAPCSRDDECSGVMVCRTDVTSPTQPRCLQPIVATPAPTPTPTPTPATNLGAGAPCDQPSQCANNFSCRTESGGPGQKRCLPPIVDSTTVCTEDTDLPGLKFDSSSRVCVQDRKIKP